MTPQRRVTEAALLGAVFFDLAAFGAVLPDVQTRLEGFGARGWLIGVILASYFAVLALAITVPQIAPSPSTDTKPDKPHARLALLRDVPALSPLFILAATAWFALACLEGTFGRLIHAKLGYGPREYGLIFGYEALLGVGVGLGLTPFAPTLVWLFACSTLYAIGAGVANPTINARCSDITPENRQGEMFGLLQAARSGRTESPYFLAAGVMILAALSAKRFVKGMPS